MTTRSTTRADGQIVTIPIPNRDSTAPVFCWCGHRTRLHSCSEIRAGRTWSCCAGCARLGEHLTA